MRFPKIKITWRFVASVLTGALATALLLYLAATLLLPHCVERTLTSMLSELVGTKSVRYESLRIDLFSAEIDKLSIGSGELPPLLFESCSLKYTPFSLLRGKLTKVTLSGLDVNITAKDGNFFLDGVNFGNGGGGKLEPATLLNTLGSLPLSIGCVEVGNAGINIQGDNISLVVPFKMTMTPSDASWSTATVFIEAAPNGQRLKAMASVSKCDSRLVAKLWTPKKIRLEAIPFGYIRPEGADLYGNLDFDVRATFAGAGFHLETLDADVKVERLRLHVDSLRIGNLKTAPFMLKLRHKEGRGLLELSGLRLGGAFPVELRKMESSYSLAEGALVANSSFELAGFPLAGPTKMRMESKADFKKPGIAFETMLLISPLKISHEVFKAEAKELMFAASGFATGSINFETIISNASLHSGALSATFPDCAIAGELKAGEVSGTLSLEDASGAERASGLKLNGIALKLPFKLPLAANVPPGKLTIKSIKLEDRPLGSLAAKLSPGVNSLAVNGRFSSSTFKGLILDFEGSGEFADERLSSDVKFFIPPYKITKPFDLGALHPKAEGILFDGGISLAGACSLDGRRHNGSLTVKLKDANIKDAGGAYAVEGVNASFSLPYLPELRSAPNQEIFFAKASSGNFSLSNGEVEARLESLDTVFVESFKASCCGGNLMAQSIALKLDSKEYEVVLHCDRISIEKFLGQLGVGHADGQGSLNGSIPVSLKDGELSFQDAFLYSTPGESGVIRLDDSGLLALGLQGAGAEGSILEIAKEALKSFSYTWAKVGMDTKGDMVEIKFQLDGKPGAPLPYRFEDGRYIRDYTHKLIFQGIRLDLNFNVPPSLVVNMSGNLKKILKTGTPDK